MDEDHQLVQTEDPVWNPRSMLAVLDGITSVRWAMILVRWGEEKDVCGFCDWMTQKARSRPQKSEQFVAFWQASGWQLAMAMRSGVTFKEATTSIMKDIDRFNEYMAKEIPADRKKLPSTENGQPGRAATPKGPRTREKATFVGNHIQHVIGGLLHLRGMQTSSLTNNNGGTSPILPTRPKLKTIGLGTNIANRDSTGLQGEAPRLMHPTQYQLRSPVPRFSSSHRS